MEAPQHVARRPTVLVLTRLRNGDGAIIPEEQPPGSIIYFACAIQPEIQKGSPAWEGRALLVLLGPCFLQPWPPNQIILPFSTNALGSAGAGVVPGTRPRSGSLPSTLRVQAVALFASSGGAETSGGGGQSNGKAGGDEKGKGCRGGATGGGGTLDKYLFC